MASLEVGDRILTLRKSGSLAATHVIVNQHQLRDDQAELLLLHLSSGSKLAVTPDHALYVDGALVAASEAKVGTALSTAANGDAALVMRVEKQLGAVINPVTDAGTLLASDAEPPPTNAAIVEASCRRRQ